MQCEMCGREDKLSRVRVEGIEMNVCSKCDMFGEAIKDVEEDFIRDVRKERSKNLKIYYIVENYSNLIKENREKMDLKQEELAKKLNIKESIVHKVESKVIEPSIELARKFERFFNIILVKSYEEKSSLKKYETSEGSCTIGDLLKPKE